MQRRTIALTLCLGLAILCLSSAALAQYQLTNLTSNVKGDARHTDPLLVNGWGLRMDRAERSGSATRGRVGRHSITAKVFRKAFRC
jgi:hypothetical protein